jgi:hypothetical protein
LLCFLPLLIGSVASVSAGGGPNELDEQLSSQKAAPSDRWSVSFESLYTFDNVQNPWLAVFLNFHRRNPRQYTFATQILSVRYRLTNTAGPSLLRGNLEMSLGPMGTAIINAPESYFVGLSAGLRYNFVQPAARVVPYVELRGGIGGTDAQRLHDSLQADCALSYIIGVGFRYAITPKWSVSLGVVDQHVSTGYFAERNFGIDSFGVSTGLEMRF